MIERFIYDRGTFYTLLRYGTIGGIVACVDFGLFQTFLLFHGGLIPSATAAFVIATCTHFCLNKYLNFRNHERSTVSQVQTYLVIVGLSYLLMVAVLTAMTHAGFSPRISKVTSIIVNAPFGFLCHRFITFGPGLRATFERLFPAAAQKAED